MARAAADYEGALRAAIHAFKYEGRRGLARPLARLALKAGRDVVDGADCVVPVPLHPFRYLHRGFNQAGDLASALGIPIANVLWRTRLTRSQTGLHAGARRRNVKHAFRVRPGIRRQKLQGALVVLVDDVRTTGATLNACADALLGAGVAEVRALTVARAAPPYSRGATAA